MNFFEISAEKMLKTGVAVLFFTASQQLSAQEKDTLKYQDIEAVKIVKVQAAEKNKSKINTTQTDLLNHDAGKFLNSVPEISGIKKAGNYATDPVLRGFKYEQLNIVIDGAANAVNACPSRMDPAVSQVNMNMVQEAEIFKGPYHFRYGTSLGGTINFVTLKPKFADEYEVGGRVSTGFESNGNIFRNEVFTELSSKKMVWNLFGSYQKGDRYKDGNGDEVRSAFLRYNLGTKGSFKWNESNLTTLQINTNQGRDVEFAALKMDLLYDKTWMFQLKHLAEFQNRFFDALDFNSYYSVVDHSMGTPDLKMVSDVKSNTYGARTELKKSWSSNIFYTGFDYKHEDAYNLRMLQPAMMKPRDGTSWQDSEIYQIGWFGEYQKVFGTSKITASARLDYNVSNAKDPSKLFQNLYGDLSANDFNHSLSLGYSRRFSERNQVSVWLGRAQRSGSLTERYINLFTVGNDAYEILGNPQLKPETNNQADVIYTFSNEKVYFQTDVFYSFLQDYISGVIRKDIMPYSMTSPGVRQMQNVEKAMKTGFESRFNWKFLPNWRTEMAVAYTYAEDLNTKKPLPEIFPLDFRWKVEADFSPVVVGLQYRFAAQQKRVAEEFGEQITPDFSVLNFTGKYEVFQNGFLNLEISNIFNRAYAEHLNRALSTNKNQRILERGRSFNLGFSWSF